MHIVCATPAPSSGRVSTANGTTLMALLSAALTPALAKGQLLQEEVGANSSVCEAVRHEGGGAPLPFWAFVVVLLLVGAVLGELGRQVFNRLVGPPVAACIPPSVAEHRQQEEP